MIKDLKKAFPNCDKQNCHEDFRISFYLHDHNNGKCVASNSSSNATCFIENQNLKSIDFFAVDECLIAGNSLMRCDAMVIKENVIWFIELKEVEWSTDRKLNKQKRQNGRKKAVKQLASTINHFRDKGVDLKSYFIAGLISFPPFAQPNPTIVPSTSSQARILEFANLCGYSELHEGNYIAL